MTMAFANVGKVAGSRNANLLYGHQMFLSPFFSFAFSSLYTRFMNVPQHESEKLKKAGTRIATATTYYACMQWFCAFLEVHAGWKTLTDQKKVLGGGEL